MSESQRSARASVEVVVVTGFLGAGKSTLLHRWLGELVRDEVAVIVNELGAVALDADRLASRVDAFREITGGCACCTTQAELVRALASFAERGVRRIFVETSGAASPAGVVRAVSRNEVLSLGGVVTVVDATRWPPGSHPGLASLADEQLGYADAVVLSNADRCADDRLVELRLELLDKNPTATFVASERGELRGSSFEALLGQRSELPPELPRSDHAGVIASIAWQRDGEISGERFGDWVEETLARYEGRLLRVKAVLAVAGIEPRMIVQGVADRIAVDFAEPFERGARGCRLVIIGFGLDREAILASLDAAAGTTASSSRGWSLP
jgi:G3E family GTPase